MPKYRITAPVSVTGNHWGLDFKHGIAETNDDALAARLSDRRYTVVQVQGKEQEATVKPNKPIPSAPPIASSPDLKLGMKTAPALKSSQAET